MANVTIKAEENGPLLVVVDKKTTVTLCRCGGSQTQPSCDGAHEKIGFKAEGSEIEIHKHPESKMKPKSLRHGEGKSFSKMKEEVGLK
ncbi:MULTISPECIES: CDGSH iron-sulfur domain-containing protein [Nitrosopumilus]|uniref:Iron-binding zinc finger CDGSH type domain-containing protein n=1 Tax=Nitrosopumilus piranensis TaxID=1582439 RepID=A0A0C5BZ73_9ARCH|nr:MULTISPECIES: CDGSH iron-sulfur domain-containing protein [Nitrosopumilus]AJM92300.1 hypothetical protein NPIRD3C_1088 [Nitrosopumilus piranensis]KAF6244242.1 hypothetical protein C6989_08065 [Nitrosopumilus sp. b2]